jgi:hypothetical protein
MKDITVPLPLKVGLEEVVEALLDVLSHDEVVDLIKELDARSADWAVTKKLHDYFVKEMKKAKKENGT